MLSTQLVSYLLSAIVGLKGMLTQTLKLHYKEERFSQLSSHSQTVAKKRNLKKIQAWMGFEPMMSAMPVQYSAN